MMVQISLHLQIFAPAKLHAT